VIYPLLLLAEQGAIQAWSEVSLSAQYAHFPLEGIADGVLGPSIDGYLQQPYLVVVEAKKGLDASNPQFQLYGQMLAAAWMNWKSSGEELQEIFGCYTISDSWTFFRGEVRGFEVDRPEFRLESSREFSERLEAEIILKLLKRMTHQAWRLLLEVIAVETRDFDDSRGDSHIMLNHELGEVVAID
jgi:hypothetical protein